MQAICIIGVFAGAIIMLFSIIQYYRALVKLKLESYGTRVFSRTIYAVCMLLMVFFLAGYVVLGVSYIGRSQFGNSDLLIAAIFFFGAVFVLVVITVQTAMSKSISAKTDEMIRTLVNAMEAKDQYTRGHSVHVANPVHIFYEHLTPRLKGEVNYAYLTDAAILHDIGKIGVPDNVLNKPGALTEEEFALIRTHPRMGKQILDKTSFSELGDIILAHHERVDQQGYYRLPPDQVPIESKMIAIAIADTFSALYSDRVYRPRKSYAVAMDILREAAGSQLDAELVGIFTGIGEPEILEASRDLFVMEQPGSPAPRAATMKMGSD